MITLIDDRDTNPRPGETMCDLETTEAGANDDDVMGVRCIAQCSGASDLNRGVNARRDPCQSSQFLIEPVTIAWHAVPAPRSTITYAHYIFAQQNLLILDVFEKGLERIARV